MRKLTFTNSAGTSIEFYKTPYLIETLDGVDTPAVAIQEQKAPYQDGTTYIDSLLDNRQIVITGAIVKPKILGDIATARAAMQSILNPKLGLGTITFQNDSLTRYATGYVSSCLLPNKDARDPYQRFQVTITCPDPFWYGAPITVVSAGGYNIFERTMPTSTNWDALAYGDGVFCAIASWTPDNITARSFDGGNSWSTLVYPLADIPTALAFGNGVFCGVVNSSNKAVISSDYGETWQTKTLPSSLNWLSITYGNGYFVAIALGTDKIAVSSDNGNTWVEKTLPSSANWESVAYGNGTFVVIAGIGSDKAAISTNNGTTWTAKTLSSSDYWLSVTYGDGVFCAVAYNSNKATISTDGGNTWSAKTLPFSDTWSVVAYGNGSFFTFCRSSTSAAASVDGGNTWSTVTLPSNPDWSNVVYGNGTFIMIADTSDISLSITGTIINILSELPAPVEIEISGPNGATAITNNEETLSVSKTLVTGEKILINTKFGQRSIYFYPISGARTNAMQYLDVDSVFWQLQPGYNNVFFTSPATLRYRERYIGV